MGLDMYAYVATRADQQREFWETAEAAEGSSEYFSRTVERPREIAYWRKHPNLHGWMEQLAERKGLEYDSFNGVELELTWEDLDQLERDIISGKVESLRTVGFFFGDPSDGYYREQDLEFIRNARAELFCGLKVFYNSSW